MTIKCQNIQTTIFNIVDQYNHNYWKIPEYQSHGY